MLHMTCIINLSLSKNFVRPKSHEHQCVSQACVCVSLRRIGLGFGRKMTHSKDRRLQELHAKS